MLELYRTANSYAQRPSALVGLDGENDWLCWQFDRAVTFYGRWVDAEASKTDKKGKPLRSLNDIVEGTPMAQPPIEALMRMVGVEVV